MECACACSFGSFALLSSNPTSSPPSFTTKLRFLRLNRSSSFDRHNNNLLIRKACGSDENRSSNGFSSTPDKIFNEEAIGAEYGEGFETFRPDGPLKVDVDFLNDRLQASFLQRIRYAMKPDEAYGLIFSLDNVVADTRALKLNTWKQLASEEDVVWKKSPERMKLDFGVYRENHILTTNELERVFNTPTNWGIQVIRKNFDDKTIVAKPRREIPGDESVQRYLLYASADHVLHKVLLWEMAEVELDRLKLRLSQLYHGNLLKLSEPMDGLKEWLTALYTVRIPCAVVSSLGRRKLVEVLERMGLSKYFQAIVTEEDGMESMAHRFLSAAVKLDRKPSMCVVFEDDPRGITAAHNCTMMAIALIGAHPAYDLVQADLAVASFNELSVINLRRLFANRGSTFMDLQKQIIERSPQRKRLRIDTIF